MKRFLTISIVSGLALIATASVALAGEVDGHNFVTPKASVTTELPSGVVYTTLGNHQVCTTKDPNHPMHRASGDCDGACVTKPEGEPTCMGSCTWVDQDGDLAFFVWDGAEEGHWSLKGGSGKYAEASGHGTWKGDAAYAGGITGNSWSGVIEMK